MNPPGNLGEALSGYLLPFLCLLPLNHSTGLHIEVRLSFLTYFLCLNYVRWGSHLILDSGLGCCFLK